MPLEFSILFIIIITYFFSKLARRFHLSEVIGLIVAGLLISSPWLGSTIISGHEETIINLGHVSIMALMFLAGLEVSWNMLLKEEKDAIVITAFTMTSSFVIGTAVFLILGFGWVVALLMGISFGITAEATKARVLLQLKKIKTRVGTLLMGIGIINDVFGVLFLVAMSFFFAKVFSYQEIGLLGGVLISFALGIWVHMKFDRFTKKIKILEKLMFIFIVPFFFVSMGIYFNFDILTINILLLLIVIFSSFLGQMVGVILTKPITKLRPKQLYLVGWGMNSKGLVELAIAFLALRVGLLPVNLYSALVVTAVVTTIVFQFVIFRMVRNNPGIMD